MIDIGDKVKWTGKKVGNFPFPDWLTVDMVGTVDVVDEEQDYPYGVWFETDEGSEYEVFVDGELERA